MQVVSLCDRSDVDGIRVGGFCYLKETRISNVSPG